MSLNEQQKQLIEHSIERVAEVAGDPSPHVYARLFAQAPEMEPLFILDTDGNARGHMLMEALDCIFDFLGPRTYSTTLIQSELINHEGFGVPPRIFTTFFNVVMETFRELLGAEWTAETDAAWDALLTELDTVVAEQAKKFGVAAV